MVGDREFGCFLYSYGRRLKFVSGSEGRDASPRRPGSGHVGDVSLPKNISLVRIIGKPTTPNEAAMPAEDDKYQFQPGGKSRRMTLYK